MAQLIVRKLSEQLVRRLKERAVQNGRSAEEEHRMILQQALLGGYGQRKKSLKQILMEMPEAGEDSDFARMPGKPRKVRL